MSSRSYSMPMLVRLVVSDVEATRRWYQNVVGFETVFDIPGTMAHLRGSRYQDVVITKGERPEKPGEGVILSFTWAGGIDELAEKVRAGGGKILEGPVDRPWNARELVMEDPNGYRLSFSRKASANSGDRGK